MFIKSDKHQNGLINIDALSGIRKFTGGVGFYIRFCYLSAPDQYISWGYSTEQERDKAFASLEEDLVELGKLKIIY